MRNRAAAIIIRNRQLLVLYCQKPGRDYCILPTDSRRICLEFLQCQG